MASDIQIEEFLMHHGVKGMHWGVHRTRTAEQVRNRELAKINRQTGRLNMDKVVEGLQLTGHFKLKQYNKAVKKDPGFTYKKLSPEAQKAYDAKARRKAYASVSAIGLGEMALVLGVGNLALNHVKGRPETINGARLATVLLAGKVGYMRASQLRAIHLSEKFTKLDTRRDQIYKEQRAAAKKSSEQVKMSTTDDVEDFLAHHGVKGMHWGVRRAHTNSAASKAAGKAANEAVRKAITNTKTSANEGKRAVSSHPKLVVASILAGAIGAAAIGAAVGGRKGPAYDVAQIGRKLFEDPEFLNAASNFAVQAHFDLGGS